MAKSFIREETPVLFSKRLRIVQVTPELVEVANYLISQGGRNILVKNITKDTLNKTKYFIGYVGDVPVAITGFKMSKWGYSSSQFNNTSDVTNKDYRRKGYMVELKLMIYRYIKQLGVQYIHIHIQKGNKVSIALAEKIGFVREKTYKDNVFMKLNLNRIGKTGVTKKGDRKKKISKTLKTRKINLKTFVEKYNTYSRSFSSWAKINMRDYKERQIDPKLNNGNVILCINTSTADTMKYMLLAYYLVIMNKDKIDMDKDKVDSDRNKVSFMYVKSGNSHNLKDIKALSNSYNSDEIKTILIDSYNSDYVNLILADMVNIFSLFMRQEYGIDSKDYLTYSHVNEMRFIRTMYNNMSLKEIYYTPVLNKSGETSSITSISLNIAKSAAKPGTLLISDGETIITPRPRTSNTHTDNVIKASLTNPPLIDTTVSYNKRVPEARIQERTVSLRVVVHPLT